MENLVTVTIRSTHYYLIDIDQGKFMVDAGWAGSLPLLKSQLKKYQIDLTQIRFLMITHHHPDHAGLAQEIKQASNARISSEFIRHTASLFNRGCQDIVENLLSEYQEKSEV